MILYDPMLYRWLPSTAGNKRCCGVQFPVCRLLVPSYVDAALHAGNAADFPIPQCTATVTGSGNWSLQQTRSKQNWLTTTSITLLGRCLSWLFSRSSGFIKKFNRYSKLKKQECMITNRRHNESCFYLTLQHVFICLWNLNLSFASCTSCTSAMHTT